jgi:NAD+ kinase
MRVAICGRNLDDLRHYLDPLDFEVVTDKPEVVISYGGDGSLLGAVRDYPGIPKCPIRDSRSNPKCPEHHESLILRMLLADELKQDRLMKLEAVTNSGEMVVGLNDVMVNKQIISSAVRYRLWLDDELYQAQIVGDGLVVAPPFGSTGYYRSITHSVFTHGIGVAFNNSTEPVNHLVVGDNTVVRLQIIRGPAVLLADNGPKMIELQKDDEVTIRRTGGEAIVLGLDIFRCAQCYQLRQQNHCPA